MKRPFLASRDARADEEDASPSGAGSPRRIREVGIPAIDQDVSRLEERDQLVDHLIDGGPAFTIIMIFRGFLMRETSSSTE